MRFAVLIFCIIACGWSIATLRAKDGMWIEIDDTLNMNIVLSCYLPDPVTGSGQGGEVFFQGYALHDLGVIPEPAAAQLGSLGALTLLLRRRR